MNLVSFGYIRYGTRAKKGKSEKWSGSMEWRRSVNTSVENLGGKSMRILSVIVTFVTISKLKKQKNQIVRGVKGKKSLDTHLAHLKNNIKKLQCSQLRGIEPPFQTGNNKTM